MTGRRRYDCPMAGEPSHKPIHTVPSPPRRGEPLWTIHVHNVTWSADISYHTELGSWEAQLFRQGVFVAGRRFLFRNDAVRWAEGERIDVESGSDPAIR